MIITIDPKHLSELKGIHPDLDLLLRDIASFRYPTIQAIISPTQGVGAVAAKRGIWPAGSRAYPYPLIGVWSRPDVDTTNLLKSLAGNQPLLTSGEEIRQAEGWARADYEAEHAKREEERIRRLERDRAREQEERERREHAAKKARAAVAAIQEAAIRSALHFYLPLSSSAEARTHGFQEGRLNLSADPTEWAVIRQGSGHGTPWAEPIRTAYLDAFVQGQNDLRETIRQQDEARTATLAAASRRVLESPPPLFLLVDEVDGYSASDIAGTETSMEAALAWRGEAENRVVYPLWIEASRAVFALD